MSSETLMVTKPGRFSGTLTVRGDCPEHGKWTREWSRQGGHLTCPICDAMKPATEEVPTWSV